MDNTKKIEKKVLTEEELYIKDDFDDNKFIDARGDVIVAKGGDGTLLRAIYKFRKLDKPFYGIGAGTENFLMNNSSQVSDTATYKKLELIKATITYDTKTGEEKTKTFQAFNDVMIGSKAGMNSWINFHIKDKDLMFGDFRGGGLIVSTAQGSTGINKNTNGSILPLSAKMWSIVGDKTKRRINHVMRPQKLEIATESRAPMIVWIDGSCKIIKRVKKITLDRGKKVTLVFNDYNEFKKKRRV